jgi:hypothetical protein
MGTNDSEEEEIQVEDEEYYVGEASLCRFVVSTSFLNGFITEVLLGGRIKLHKKKLVWVSRHISKMKRAL